MRTARGLAAAAVLLAFIWSTTSPALASFGSSPVPRDLTYWGMFANATLVVKLVILLLILASIVTWSTWIRKLTELNRGRRHLQEDNALLADTADLGQVIALVHQASSRMLSAAKRELAQTGRVLSFEAAEGLKERVAARLSNEESVATERMLQGTAILATVGAIAPFVGLFGTVWGIMNSFIGISQSNTTNLAVIAPGIAEALLATALGLVAAIPAVTMYNHVARTIAGQRRLLAEASTNIACLVSREVDLQLAASRF